MTQYKSFYMRPLHNTLFCPIATEYENDNPQNSNVFRRFYFHLPCTKTKLSILQRSLLAHDIVLPKKFFFGRMRPKDKNLPKYK